MPVASWLPFAAAICVPLIVLAIMGLVSFKQTQREAELRAQRTVQALAEHALRTFRAHDLIIKAVDSHVAGWSWDTISASRELHDFFRRLIQNANDINTIFAIGPTGREGSSSLVFPLVPVDMNGRSFYEELRKSGGLHISDVDVGRINKQRYFSFSRRRTTADDAFDGIISVSVNPAYFEAFYQTVVESATDSISLVRSDGLLLVRVPAAPSGGDHMLPRSPGGLMAAIAVQPESGTFSQRGSVDGIERIYAYRRVGDYPLYTTFGLSYENVWAVWQRNMLAYALACLIAIVLLVAAAALVRRHSARELAAANRHLQETARRLAAEETNRAKDEFLATLGHELRNPLSSIAASTEILRRAQPGDGKATHAVEIIGRQVDHLRRLVNDLLDVARSIYGKLNLQPEIVCLTDVAALVATTHPGAMRGEVTVSASGPRVFVEADPTRLRQMIENLVDNAQKYGGRHIDVRTVDRGDTVELAVADDGDGIAAELLPTLFEPFVQGKQPLDRATGGLGLGLALCSRIAAAHGGSLHASSPGVGRGSTFVIRLPKVDPPAVVDVPAARLDQGSRERVLIVEDQEDTREAMRMLLELDGNEIECASSGAEALDTFDAFRPMAVIVDIGLPGMDGYAVARAIRSRPNGGGACLIALTGYGQPDDKRRALDAGFDHHLTKPVDFDRLKALLASAETLSSRPTL